MTTTPHHRPPRIVADELPLFAAADPPPLEHDTTPPADDGWTWDDTTQALWGHTSKERRT
jgi:hypothetical protein